MGSRIAQRLLDHGYRLSVYDMDLAKADAIAAHGGVVSKNIRELARTADVLLSCLTNDEAVRSVFTGPEGVFAGARSGTVVLEMSTISPESSRELHRLGARSGIAVLDVAISGSTPAAEEGILTLLVGGNRELFRAAEPIFQAIAKIEKQYPRDYRFPYERAKLVAKGAKKKEAFKALNVAAEKAINTGKANEMLTGLETDKTGDFSELSQGRYEWSRLVAALKRKDTSLLGE